MAEIHTAYLSLGSNQGDRNRNLLTAIALIADKIGIFSAVSLVYETEPWGFESKNKFLNSVVSVETTYSPLELLSITQEIERDMGRNKKDSLVYQDRIIDIDILFYDDWIFKSESLELPHPLLHLRQFVLMPLNEIKPNFVHPVLNKKIKDLAIASLL
jgi:2-amino-4-hydroxy-6-hydroxymethyldihydropteridine diphosphokinase